MQTHFVQKSSAVLSQSSETDRDRVNSDLTEYPPNRFVFLLSIFLLSFFSFISLSLFVALTNDAAMGALKTREWTTWEWTSRHDETGLDNAGVDNVARRSKGGQRGSGQGGTKKQGWTTQEWTTREWGSMSSDQARRHLNAHSLFEHRSPE